MPRRSAALLGIAASYCSCAVEARMEGSTVHLERDRRSGGFAQQHQRQLQQPELVLFSGGTAMNSLAAALGSFSPRIAHVLPVSDDGGSTAEIVRVLGGPAVGDIRSRCLRLSDVSSPEAAAVKTLLQHRLPKNREEARAAWLSIVEGTDPLWEGITSPYKHTIRAFLIHFHTQLLVRSAADFDLSNGSVGNFFFAGARLFLNSLNAAIFLYSRVSGLPEQTAVLPVIRSEADKTVVLGAVLEDGTLLRGQNAISHPSIAPGLSRSVSSGVSAAPDAASVTPAVVDKEHPVEPLPSPIRRVCYLSTDLVTEDSSHAASVADQIVAEVFPQPNPLVLDRLARTQCVIYGAGSLYTSICPCLIVRGIGEAIAGLSPAVPRVLMLNGFPDRETTSANAPPMDACAYVRAVVDALNRVGAGRGQPGSRLSHGVSEYVNVLLYPSDGEECGIRVDAAALARMGVRAVAVPCVRDAKGRALYDPQGVVDALSRLLTVE